MNKFEIKVFEEKIMEAFITKTKQSEIKIGELEQNLKVKEAELEYVAKIYDNDKKQLTLELENATQKLNILEGKFKDVKHSNTIKDEEIDNLNNKIAELNTIISAKDEEINKLEIEISDLNGNLSSKDEELNEIRKDIQLKEKLIEEKSTIIKEIEAELIDLKPPEISTDVTSSGERLICAKCGAVGKDIKTIEDKSKPLSYMGNIPMYAKYKVCKKCGHNFSV